MLYKRFGDISLSRLGFGAMRLPLLADGSIDEAQVCAMVDRDALAKALNLPANQQIMYSQPIGYPGK